MSRIKTLLLCVFVVIIVPRYNHALHIVGHWSLSSLSGQNGFKILARFGFQKTDLLLVNKTRGYIFGNVTSSESTASHNHTPPVLLVLVNYAHFKRVYDVLQSVSSKEDVNFCSRVLSVVNDIAFEPRCNPNGNQDVYRHVPCSSGKLCSDEDQPANVFPSSQMTYRVQDLAQARFWYVLLLTCYLDQNCSWTSHNRSINLSLDYDLFLVNGHPNYRVSMNLIDRWHFSNDDEDLASMSLVALLANILLLGLEIRAYNLQSTERGQFLLLILALQVLRLTLLFLHWSLFSRDGVGLAWAEIFARHILTHIVDYSIVLLLILIGKGWKIRTNNVRHRLRTAFMIVTFLAMHLAFYGWAVASTEWWLETCVFDLWQGWAILMIRIFAMCWFFAELRESIKLENNEQKKIFLLHFGSGFLVWFVYMAVLGAFSSRIPLMSRKMTIEGLTQLANFVVLAVLTHLFYPRSSNRWFFLNPANDLDDATNVEELAAAGAIDSPASPKRHRRKPPTTKNGYTKLVPLSASLEDDVLSDLVTMDDLDSVWRVTDKTSPEKDRS